MFVLSKCGRIPLAVTCMANCVKYWAKVTQMNAYKYPHKC